MELTIGASFAFVSCLYLLVFASPVSAKCRGKWAIHACFGGNGKRSDPNMGPESNIEPSLLHRVLISDAQELNRMLQNAKSAQQEGLALSSAQNEYDELKDDTEEGYRTMMTRNAPEVRDLRRYLSALKLQHALREKAGDMI